jgi:hypothetical protein
MPIVLKSGSLNLLKPAGPVLACNGVALHFTSGKNKERNDISENVFSSVFIQMYRGADKSSARPGKKQARATEHFEFHISYL